MLDQVGLRARFEVMATGDEVAAHKPDPAVYLLALDRLGLQAEEAIAFEDTAHGVAAAHAAGLRCVAVPNPYAGHARFMAADLLLPSAAALSPDAVLAKLALRKAEHRSTLFRGQPKSARTDRNRHRQPHRRATSNDSGR